MADSPNPQSSGGQLVPEPTPLPVAPLSQTTTPPLILVLNMDDATQDGTIRRFLWAIAGWMLRKFWPLLVAVLGFCWWIATEVNDVYKKLHSLDDRIDARVAAKGDLIRKEVAAETKEVAEEFSRLKEALEYEQWLYEASCKEDYDSVFSTYSIYVAKLKPKEIPTLVRPRLHRTLIHSIYGGKRYSFLSNSEYDAIEATLRKETTLCANYLSKLSLIHSANGNYDRAISSVQASLENVWSQPTGDPQDSFLAHDYAAFVVCELQKQKGTAEERANATWQSLSRLESRKIASTSAILSHLEAMPMQDIVDKVSIREGKAYADSMEAMQNLLASKYFVMTPFEEKRADGVIVVRYMLSEKPYVRARPIRNPTPEPKLPQPEC